MPANLNALIRYKTIDRLLGTGRKYTLSELIEHCSQNLGESRGIYKTISKRTIQEDIRILRSDILGFNAPIKNRFGKYFYTKADYSIFNTHISNINILKRVYDFLLEVRDDVGDEKLDKLLVEIGSLIPEEEFTMSDPLESGMIDSKSDIHYSIKRVMEEEESVSKPKVAKANPKIAYPRGYKRKVVRTSFRWNEILGFVN